MKSPKSIDRSFQNQRNEVIETDVPRSGLNRSYRNHCGGLVLGRLYPLSIQHLMPADKFNGSNEGKITFERLSTPVVDTIDVCTHNFLVTNRSVDNRWEKFMTPTKLNNMNSNVMSPRFKVMPILETITTSFSSCLAHTAANTWQLSYINLRNLFNAWNNVYLSDAGLDLVNQIYSIAGGTSTSVTFDLSNADQRELFVQTLLCWYNFFVGKGSLLDYLGYKSFFNPKKLRSNFLALTSSGYLANYLNTSKTLYDVFYNTSNIAGYPTIFTNIQGGVSTKVDYGYENEIALRAYYAIWFEYYRNYDLEPRSNTLPEYHDFGGTTIFGSYTFADLHFLVVRIRSWQADQFTTAGIDDISRHVFAPINDQDLSFEILDDSPLQSSDYFDNRIKMQSISWRNPSNDTLQIVDVPIPHRLIDELGGSSSSNTSYSLELQTLRKSQMLENFLKRIYYGGDEYRDRMLHLYGAKIEDYRVNRPQWLSSSLDVVDPRQEVANTGISPTNSDPTAMPIGARVATATAAQSGQDGFTEFTPEFAVYISIVSLMPHATYDPYILQNGFIRYTDFPIPQFANSMEDVISSLEIARGVSHSAFGYAPYAHAYRGRVDEIHGDYHDNKYDYCFLRFWSGDSPAAVPNLSWSFIHCRPQLPMFVDSVLLNGQAYGTFKHNFLCESPLPSPVEEI